ncbi:bifunctional diaminohydroxyphosphoribosylaminopyrimidine deaminase/5-amino-6-(5-phosphoribosylamino)uracil reductase RibD [Enteractinococcus helveticum]|uniref:Riboflavin biosynthesis protein RibD n=1 Tax=Enteractinococcus helveticum TaxID=1837282 RepID=A0A1B7LZD8_9MICC|nr:bifunctional diaminohydroxyphosphoribosylaminopyrimidine deaminase/5-amino-6-(5-phosphoribosylamino)uracil reductase RibD [Enteractinococcus helveticum]OAV60859.1 hypothetical protein A6F49_10245 [Enteractinococcus helveticum]
MLSHTQLATAMQHAIMLAHRGPAHDPNPQVGCVIVDAGGTVVAEGFHNGAGTDHAEIVALTELDPSLDPAELTAVVTLEPCNHTGKTPPCAQALLASGIGTIVYGQPDIGAHSSGGATTLFAHGRQVIGGIESAATADLIAPWHATTNQSRDQVIAKWAQSLDGRLAAADGTSQWITSATARRHVHVQRALADVIITTTATVGADNPSLTARDAAGDLLVPAQDQPLPVVFGTGPLDDDAKVHAHPALHHRGLDRAPQYTGTDLAADFAQLTELVGCPPRVFLEAGPRFLTSVLAAGLVDKLLIYTAPTVLGGPYHAIGDIGISTLEERLNFTFYGVHRLDTDLVTTLRKDH